MGCIRQPAVYGTAWIYNYVAFRNEVIKIFFNNLKGVSAMKLLLSIFTVLFAVILLSGYSFAQDAVKVDPKHYKVEFENDQVRVLRITYAPGEKGVMHSHPEGMVVFLSNAKGKFTYSDGKTETNNFKKGFTS